MAYGIIKAMPKKDYRRNGVIFHNDSKKKYTFIGFGDGDSGSMFNKAEGIVRVTLKELEENYTSMSALHKGSQEKRRGQMW